MLERVKQWVSVITAIVLGIKELAKAVETAGHGEAKKEFVMGAFEVLITLDDALFSGFIGEKLMAAADAVVELWVKLDKVIGIFKPEEDEDPLDD
jgi:hypothetical protein